MKKLLQSRLVRVCCQVLVVAMLATLIPNGLTTKAYAQSGSALGSEKPKKVGVVEFINDSNRFGQIISKNATSAFIMECNKTGKPFQIEASEEEMKAKMDELGIRLPATSRDCVKLADELELDGIIQGYIKSISVKGSGANKVATANVAVQYVDCACGEILIGAQAKGESSARIGFTADEDTLVVEAIAKAIQMCVYKIQNYSIPKATVHANEGNDSVILNAGIRNNLQPGMRMVVMRGANPVQDDNLEDSTIVSEMRVVGYIEVTTVTGIDAVAKIVKQNVGVKPEDICLGLYTDVYVSKYSPVEEEVTNINSKKTIDNAKKQNTATNIGYILLGVAALVGLASLFSTKDGGGESGPEVDTGTKPGQLRIAENSNGYIAGKIVGIKIYNSDGEYVQLNNDDSSPDDVTNGEYDGTHSVKVNVFEDSRFASLLPNEGEQQTYTAKWRYQYYDSTQTEYTVKESKASGSAKWTLLTKCTDLEPSSTITANDFEEGTAFIWESENISGDNVQIRYKVEVWDSSSSNKKIFYTTNKYLSTEQLATLYEYFSGMSYQKKTFAWRVGVQNTQDGSSDAYWWSNTTKFTVDSLPPSPPSKGHRRHK